MPALRKKASSTEAENPALLAAAASKHERYSDAIGHYSAALRKLQSSGESDVRLEAEIVGGLAATASETVDLRALEKARKAYEKIAWPRSLDGLRFRAISALRVGSMLEGDLAGAFFAAREALGVAPGPAESAFGEISAAVAARMLGDNGAERLQLRRAWDQLRERRWEPGDDNARQALLTFAVEAADSMTTEARKALTLYRSLSPKSSAASRAAERRFAGLEAMAAGRVADAAGDDDAAIGFYEDAYEHWRAIGFDARAAVVALDLRRLTGDESYAAFVRSIVTRAPKAWFAKQLRAAASPADMLSPAERVVLSYLINGDSAKSIGEKLDRSPFTISNHTRKIFQAFGLNSRGKVIARCAELGITASKLGR